MCVTWTFDLRIEVNKVWFRSFLGCGFEIMLTSVCSHPGQILIGGARPNRRFAKALQESNGYPVYPEKVRCSDATVLSLPVNTSRDSISVSLLCKTLSTLISEIVVVFA